MGHLPQFVEWTLTKYSWWFRNPEVCSFSNILDGLINLDARWLALGCLSLHHQPYCFDEWNPSSASVQIHQICFDLLSQFTRLDSGCLGRCAIGVRPEGLGGWNSSQKRGWTKPSETYARQLLSVIFPNFGGWLRMDNLTTLGEAETGKAKSDTLRYQCHCKGVGSRILRFLGKKVMYSLDFEARSYKSWPMAHAGPESQRSTSPQVQEWFRLSQFRKNKTRRDTMAKNLVPEECSTIVATWSFGARGPSGKK